MLIICKIKMSLMKRPLIINILILLVQKEGSIMQKELDNLKENIIFEVSSWGGLGPNPGTSGTLITNDRKIYKYRTYFKNDDSDDILEVGIINDNDYDKLMEFIKTEAISDKYESQMIFDAGFSVNFLYNNELINTNNYALKNNKDLSLLYDKAKKLVDSFIN